MIKCTHCKNEIRGYNFGKGYEHRCSECNKKISNDDEKLRLELILLKKKIDSLF